MTTFHLVLVCTSVQTAPSRSLSLSQALKAKRLDSSLLRGSRGGYRRRAQNCKGSQLSPLLAGCPHPSRCGDTPHRATFPKGKAKRLPPQTAELASESTGKPKYALRKAAVSPVRLCAPHKSFPCAHFSFLIAPKAKIAIYRYRNRKKI